MSVTVTDLFCGAGGSSIGAETAGTTLRLGLNHWARAIETHQENFPHADHDCEDVSSLTTSQIRRYPDSDILLASPECTNHSLAKGARRRSPQAASLFDDGPAGDAEQDRSRATMWDVVRFAEQKLLKGKPYKAIVVENVVDAYKWGYGDDGGLFAAWRQAMKALGYRSEVVWLNSMFCPPTPQSRDRMYVVFWLKALRRPDLRVSPPSWCPSCERIVDGEQTWKKPQNPWGRYGAQYVYGCPACRSIVIPGAFPAATAIDWAFPIGRIGDRARPLAENTRERIRRGLERLAREPFAIRLLQGGAPRPLTLPLVTMTQRRDLAMVIPVGGNTFERTPGNRARNPVVQPLDTLHASLDRALIVANRMNNVPRVAAVEPSPPVLTGGTVGIVHLRQHQDVKPAEEPIGAVSAGGGHHALIVSNYGPGGKNGKKRKPSSEAGGWAREADALPFGTVTATDGHALVVPYARTGKAIRANREPAATLTTRDRLSLIVPPMGNVEPRIAETDPAPTQTTTTRAALVVTDDDIDGCGFRMFELDEIARAMAMDAHPTSGGTYVVHGNKRERMAQYGNAVTPPAMELLVSRLLPILDAP